MLVMNDSSVIFCGVLFNQQGKKKPQENPQKRKPSRNFTFAKNSKHSGFLSWKTMDHISTIKTHNVLSWHLAP